MRSTLQARATLPVPGHVVLYAKPLQLFEFMCGYEVPAHPTVARNGDRPVLRLFSRSAAQRGQILDRIARNENEIS